MAKDKNGQIISTGTGFAWVPLTTAQNTEWGKFSKWQLEHYSSNQVTYGKKSTHAQAYADKLKKDGQVQWCRSRGKLLFTYGMTIDYARRKDENGNHLYDKHGHTLLDETKLEVYGVGHGQGVKNEVYWPIELQWPTMGVGALPLEEPELDDDD